jgi:hypothetical protein
MLAANARGSLIMLSTPAGRRGVFHDVWHDGDASWTRIRVPASECSRITAQFLEEERKAWGKTLFQAEYCLAFLDSGAQAFPTDRIDAMFSDDSVRPLWA